MISCEIEQRFQNTSLRSNASFLHGFSTSDEPPDLAAVASRTEQPHLGDDEAVPPSHGHTWDPVDLHPPTLSLFNGFKFVLWKLASGTTVKHMYYSQF